MRNISGPERREAYKRIKELCSLRLQRGFSEDQIADKLGFGSADAMHIQLKNWGLPEWMIKAQVAKEEGKKRKARSTGDVRELPAAGRAIRLFREDVEWLTYYLNQLPGLKEQLQAERFVSSYWVGDNWEYYRKSDFSEEGWKELCEELGEDPNEEVVRLPVELLNFQGATATPWKGLIPLIALHAIMYETVDSLIEVLHPDPSSVNRAELYDEKKGYVSWLKTYSDRLAKTVRGGKVRTGHHPAESPEDYEAFAGRIGKSVPFLESIGIRVRHEKHPCEIRASEDVVDQREWERVRWVVRAPLWSRSEYL